MTVKTPEKKKKIAIIGSGVSGLGALYTLRNTGHDVHVFEAADRLGGHTNTLPFYHGEKAIMVDTGFIVMNTATYPNFIPFLKELGITPVATAMTFGVSRDYGAFEWSGTSLASIFAQRSNALRPRFWRMIYDIVRFNLFALDVLSEEEEAEAELSIGDYLHREGYSDVFRDDYLIPMTACVWSTDADKCALSFPAKTLVRFMWNHHLLSTIAKRPDWLTIKGGSKQYIDRLMEDFPKANVHLSSSVKAVESCENGKVVISFGKGRSETFDEVLLACHGDQAYQIIEKSATGLEKDIMSNFHTSENKVYMHSDRSLLPKREIAWSAWNYLTTSSSSSRPSSSGNLNRVSLTYNMNILQHIPTSAYGNVLVTMNPPHAPNEQLTQADISYRHPLYNAAAVRSQNRLHEIQGKRGIWYAGAWTGYGFHEDGFASGMNVGRQLGGNVPWAVVDAKMIRGVLPVWSWKDHLARFIVYTLQLFVGLLDLSLARSGGARPELKKRKVL